VLGNEPVLVAEEVERREVRPTPRLAMPGVNACASQSADSTLTAWTCRQVGRSTVESVPWSNAAAQWTSTSQRPHRASTSAAAGNPVRIRRRTVHLPVLSFPPS
jgi:hypothetical protein